MKILKAPIFSMAFRPFFLLAALSSIIYGKLMAMYFGGSYEFPGVFFDLMSWHSHEMIFGFALILITGFLLTASTHWSGNPPKGGIHLLILTLLWFIERIVYLSPIESFPVVLLVGIPFLPYFAYLLYQQLKGNPKNTKILLPWVFAFFICKMVFILGEAYPESFSREKASLFALELIRLLIVVISGRVLPFFIQKRFTNFTLHIPKPVMVAPVIASLILLLAIPFWESEKLFSILYLIIGITNLVRFAFFHPHKSFSEPMISILFAGYFFLFLGPLLNFFKFFYPFLDNGQAPLHTFTTGAIGLFGLGIMVRASLGHTGRPIKADKWITIAFYSTIFGAASRVLIPLINIDYLVGSLHWSSGFWVSGFVIYLFKFSKMLFRPRID